MLDPDDYRVIEDAKAAGGVLVTWDHVVREAAGAITPYEALDRAVAEGHGTPEAQTEISRLRALTPAQLTAMAKGADRTWRSFHRDIPVNLEMATQTRLLRVIGHFSWRYIARYWSSRWSAPWGANQIAGMVICKKSAELLGEDFMASPWN